MAGIETIHNIEKAPHAVTLRAQTMSASINSALPPSCPKCSGHGLARGLVINHDSRTLRYECETCRHEWDITDADPVPTWNGIPVEPS